MTGSLLGATSPIKSATISSVDKGSVLAVSSVSGSWFSVLAVETSSGVNHHVFTSGNASVRYALFSDILPAPGNFGLEVRDASGVLVFQSQAEYLNIYSVYSGGDLSWTQNISAQMSLLAPGGDYLITVNQRPMSRRTISQPVPGGGIATAFSKWMTLYRTRSGALDVGTQQWQAGDNAGGYETLRRPQGLIINPQALYQLPASSM